MKNGKKIAEIWSDSAIFYSKIIYSLGLNRRRGLNKRGGSELEIKNQVMEGGKWCLKCVLCISDIN